MSWQTAITWSRDAAVSPDPPPGTGWEPFAAGVTLRRMNSDAGDQRDRLVLHHWVAWRRAHDPVAEGIARTVFPEAFDDLG